MEALKFSQLARISFVLENQSLKKLNEQKEYQRYEFGQINRLELNQFKAKGLTDH